MSDFRFIKPQAPRRTIYMVGLAVTALIGAAGAFIAAGTAGQSAQIAEMRETIARGAAMQGNTGAIYEDGVFYTGDTPQLAQATLQSNLQELARGFDIDIEVIRADAIEQVDGFVRLNLTLNGVAPEARLGDFLHGLGALEPLIVVEQLSLRRARTSRSDPIRRVAFQTQVYGVSER